MKNTKFMITVFAFLTLLLMSAGGCVAAPVNDTAEAPASKRERQAEKTAETSSVVSDTALKPESIAYLGAFLVPDDGEAEAEMFSYGGEALCFNPSNDSLFITGHNWFAYVAEISIPGPILSKDMSQLNKAQVIQGFFDIRGGLFDDWTMEIPRAGLEAVGDKLFFCYGEHMEEGMGPGTHGYTDLSLNPAQKVCAVGDYLYSTNDYIFSIPEKCTGSFDGCDLLTGRFRDGGWSGMGPSLFAISGEDIVNAENDARIDAHPVIKYDDSYGGDDGRKMNGYSHADAWTGGAFVSCGAGEAILFAGTHGYGSTWYGFSNGVVYPTSGDENEKVPEVPDYPHDQRGWWNDDFRACLMLYDVTDAVKVMAGELEPYEIQPYTFVDLTEYMLADRDETVMQYLGGVAYDVEANRLYVLELMADEARPVVHVFTFE